MSFPSFGDEDSAVVLGAARSLCGAGRGTHSLSEADSLANPSPYIRSYVSGDEFPYVDADSNTVADARAQCRPDNAAHSAALQ